MGNAPLRDAGRGGRFPAAAAEARARPRGPLALLAVSLLLSGCSFPTLSIEDAPDGEGPGAPDAVAPVIGANAGAAGEVHVDGGAGADAGVAATTDARVVGVGAGVDASGGSDAEVDANGGGGGEVDAGADRTPVTTVGAEAGPTPDGAVAGAGADAAVEVEAGAGADAAADAAAAAEGGATAPGAADAAAAVVDAGSDAFGSVVSGPDPSATAPPPPPPTATTPPSPPPVPATCVCTRRQSLSPVGVDCASVIPDRTNASRTDLRKLCNSTQGFAEDDVACGEIGTYVTCGVASDSGARIACVTMSQVQMIQQCH